MPAFGLAFLWLSYQRPDAPPPPEEPPPPLKPPPEPPPLEPPPEEDEEEPFLEALSLPSFLYLARSFLLTISQKISSGTMAKGVSIPQATIKLVHGPGSAT